MISIAALIYRSPAYADALHGALHRHTPHLADGRAEFFFVANDPTDALVAHLQLRGYRFFENRNAVLSAEELRARGFAGPEYIRRVYQGWNVAIGRARGDKIVLINSDMMVAPHWLDALELGAADDTVISSQIVERHHERHGVNPLAIHGEFGRHPGEFDEAGFIERIRPLGPGKAGLARGGVYMPTMFRREHLDAVGLFPEGNLLTPTGRVRYGDEDLFARLAAYGVRHETALGSMAYHFKEGEMDER